MSQAINVLIGGFVLILQYDGLYQFITPNMYKVVQKKTTAEKFKSFQEDRQNADLANQQINLRRVMEQKMKEAGSITKMQTINYSFFSILRNNMQRFCPLQLQVCCLKQSVQDRLFQMSYKKFRKEIDITHLLKTLRIVKAGLQKKFTPTDWKLIKDEG